MATFLEPLGSDEIYLIVQRLATQHPKALGNLVQTCHAAHAVGREATAWCDFSVLTVPMYRDEVCRVFGMRKDELVSIGALSPPKPFVKVEQLNSDNLEQALVRLVAHRGGYANLQALFETEAKRKRRLRDIEQKRLAAREHRKFILSKRLKRKRPLGEETHDVDAWLASLTARGFPFPSSWEPLGQYIISPHAPLTPKLTVGGALLELERHEKMHKAGRQRRDDLYAFLAAEGYTPETVFYGVPFNKTLSLFSPMCEKKLWNMRWRPETPGYLLRWHNCMPYHISMEPLSDDDMARFASWLIQEHARAYGNI